MPPIPLADNFLAGSLLSLLLPVGLLIAIVIWFARTIRRLPANAGTSTAPPPGTSHEELDAVRAEVQAPPSEP
jgi:hypothetical protein